MTIAEYRLRIKAYQLSKLDREREIYMQAWSNQQVKATKKKGKGSVPVFKSFKDFFDFEEYEANILGGKRLATEKAEMNEFKRLILNSNRKD